MILDYTSPNYFSDIKQAGPSVSNSLLGKFLILKYFKSEFFCRFDIILDAAGLPETELEKYVDCVNSCGSIITLRSPLLSNIDTHGILYGSVKSAIDLLMPNLTSGVFKKGSLIKWAFFMPCETAVKEISSIVTQNKVRYLAFYSIFIVCLSNDPFFLMTRLTVPWVLVPKFGYIWAALCIQIFNAIKLIQKSVVFRK